MRPVIIRDDDDLPPTPPRATRPGGRGLGFVLALLFLLAIGARSIANYVIEWQWWKEIKQTETWLSMLAYNLIPIAAATVFILAMLWLAHAAGVRRSGVRMGDYPNYTRIALLVLIVLSVLMALATVDAWTIVRYAGGAGTDAGGWRDPAFGHPLSFYLFDLPLYRMALRLLLGLTVVSILVYWFAARGWSLRERFSDLRAGADIDIRELGLGELLESRLMRVAGAIGLCALAARLYLGRYSLLTGDHGFMVGVDYVGEHVTVPLIWFAVLACVAAAAMLWIGRFRWTLLLVAAALVLPGLISTAVNLAYVRPSEISLQRPFIERHIAGTRSAFALDQRTKEVEFAAKIDSGFDPAEHRAVLDNVRLWDWQAFHDTVIQIQALRPYYVFPDSDVDRYMLPDSKGKMQLQQVLLAPRELDVRQMPEARTGWINPHFIYTHGYGIVVAEANRITSDGLPLLFIQDAPPEIKNPGFKLTKPQIYYGEAVHEPVFVRTAQAEFDYPSGSENVQTRYSGLGGFPIASFPMRIAAAVREGDWNILLTSYLTGESRMMIRRKVLERLDAAAGFIEWDRDPYLVITEAGRLVWIVDGYTASDSHPYSRSLRTSNFGSVNYIRNSVKATVDAYDGNLDLYVFDNADPIIRAYRKLFPKLFQDQSAMPADLRAHARYPEMIFRIQAEVYRAFHMRDPEAFYNKEDLWDVANNTSQDGAPAPGTPTYVLASLPGSKQLEFLLIIPFTPRSKDNLIGLMVARCDGDRLGEIVFLQLSKQELVFGPMQIKARINQDQNISKDLTLWNQQGSKVIRGQMLVLPIEKTFLYVEPIYLQAAQAPMPQLRKVALAMGSQIAYGDTYPQALAQLGLGPKAESPPPVESETAGPRPVMVPSSEPRLDRARESMRRYRDLLSQGKFAEAGRELEALQEVLK